MRSLPRVQVCRLVRPDDMQQSLRDAGVNIMASQERCLQECAERASDLAWWVIAGQLSPSPDRIAQVGDELKRIKRAIINASPEAIDNLTMAVSVSGAPEPLGIGAGTAVPIQSLLAQLGEAIEAINTGELRERRSLAGEPKSRVRELGFELIASYTKLTGRAVALSRQGTGDDAGKPAGPLVRFLRSQFAFIRGRIVDAKDIPHLAPAKCWKPSDETFVNWIRMWAEQSQPETSSR